MERENLIWIENGRLGYVDGVADKLKLVEGFWNDIRDRLENGEIEADSGSLTFLYLKGEENVATVSIYRIHDPFGDEPVKYITAHDGVWYEGKGVLIPIEVVIPDRFKYDASPEGRDIVHIDSIGYFLAEVLDVGASNEPVIKWWDEKLKCNRTVSLEVKRDSSLRF